MKLKTEISEVDVLAIGAHPDDVEINAGGFVARLVSQGRCVGMLDLTRGEMGTRGTPKTRHQEALNAAEILGVEFRHNLDMGDSRLENSLAHREVIARVLRKCRPTFCLVSWFEAKHPDHAIAGQLVHEASWIAGLHQYDLGSEPHRPSRVFFYPSRYEFVPSFVVDITNFWETKMKACLAFASQFYQKDSTEPLTEIAQENFMKNIEARARQYGRQIGAQMGEPYFLHESVALDDPFRLLDEGRF